MDTEKKMVGNACRTKNQIRHSKSSGLSFEYDCQESLKAKYPDVYLTKQRGFQLMYDIQTDIGKTVWECKRLKGISWNQLVDLYAKLRDVRPEDYSSYILFKSNHQPCLVFDGNTIKRFEDCFSTPFIKHTPVKRNKLDPEACNRLILSTEIKKGGYKNEWNTIKNI